MPANPPNKIETKKMSKLVGVIQSFHARYADLPILFGSIRFLLMIAYSTMENDECSICVRSSVRLQNAKNLTYILLLLKSNYNFSE